MFSTFSHCSSSVRHPVKIIAEQTYLNLRVAFWLVSVDLSLKFGFGLISYLKACGATFMKRKS